MKNTDPILHSRQTALTPPLRRTALALLISSCFGMAHANPTLPQVLSGQATFNQQGNVFSITNTPNTIIKWQSFSINPGELTRFIQQNANSAVLNRITGQDPSQILGALQSNGKVFLINPNGVLFGRDARVDVNGLVASSLGLSNQDFLAGKMNFNGASSAGAVSNQGSIDAGSGSKVLLIAPNVTNSGIITAPNGEVVLAAGHSVQLADAANPGLQVVVSAPSDQALNVGQVIAQGGKIGMYGALINQRGSLNANSAVVGENGKIVLQASGKAMLETGSVTSASNSAGTGGQVAVLGDQVGLTGDAHIDVSGAKGGGTVLLGGDYQGKNAAIPNARQVFLGSDATVAADAVDSGNGGKVIVWGDQTARVFGSISARGGAASGDGGFVETSGHYLAVDGIRVDTRSSRGKQGNWLLDPYDIEVVAGGVGGLGNVDQFGDAPITGTTSIGADLISNATSNVTLQALHRINFNSAINIAQANVGLTAQAGEAIDVKAAITTNGGAVTLSANDAASGTLPGNSSNVTFNAAITTNGGAVTISGANVASNGIGSINVGSGNLSLSSNTAGGGIVLTGAGDQLIGSGVANQTVTLQADNISFSGNINFGGAGSHASVRLAPWSNARPITLGAIAANALYLQNDQLNRISADTLNIGNSNSGNISVPQAINLAQITTGTGIKNLNLESGGNITVSNQLTMLQPDSYLQLKTGVGGTLTVDSGGSLQANNLMLQADKMSLGGSTASLSGGQVTLERRTDGEIDIGSGAADSSTSLGLTDTELKTIAAGHITVGGHTFNGPLNLLGSLDLSGLSSLNLLELRTSGAMNLGGPLTVAKDLMVAGNISANGTVNVGGQFTLDGGAWQQNSASLPAFYAHDFNLQNGSFLRVQGGDGSSAAPYRIADIYGLQGINTLDMSNNYVLAANIDASGTTNWNQGAGFTSIANGDVPGYAGMFDGAGHVISGLMVNTANLPGTSGVGLFARLKNGNVSNLSLQGGSITGRYNVGAVVGLNDGGTLDNVFSSASVTGSNAVGGLVGANSGVIKNSGASGSVTGVNSDGGAAVGGLAGTNSGSGLISVSTASGAVNGARELVGGLVGSNQATITQSYATGNVSGSRSVGGLVGGNSGSISDAYATGAVGMASGADMTLVHENLGGLAGSNSGTISNVFSSGAVNGSGFTAAIGGVVGSNAGGTVNGAYWDKDNSGQQTDNGGASGLDAEHMQQQSSFNGFNFSNSAVWRIYSGHTTPMLKAFLKPLEVNVSGAATSKVYDGQFAIFNGTLVYTGLLDGDTGANGVLGYQSARNVGSYALDGLWSTKYDISLIGANSLSITPRMLGVTVGGSKVYDGTSAFGGATYVLSNVVAGDDIHASGNAQFLDKNAGSGKTVNASGLGLSGDASGNYMLASDTASGSADISRATLNLGTVSGINKVYDVNNSAGINAALAGVLANDQVSLANVQASFGDKNAGHGKTINYSGSGALSGTDGGNYVLGAYSGTTTADIAARALNLSFTGINKTYDGNTGAGLNISDDRVAGDVLNLSGNAAFADKNAGTGKTVSVSNVGVTGADAGNYVLNSHSGSTTADIAARTLNLSFSGINKTYDGNTGAGLNISDDRVAGDALNLAGNAAFADKNAGSNKTVNVSNVGVTGTDAGNYVLSSHSGSTTADIAARALNVSATGVNKIYDGGTAANVVLGDDRVAGDVLGLAASASFADKNVGAGKVVSLNGVALSGQDAGNYFVVLPAGLLASITPAALNLTGLVAGNKVYDGTTNAAVSAGVSGLLGQDVVSVVGGSGSFADKNAGTDKLVTASGFRLAGGDAGNYVLNTTGGTAQASISQKLLSTWIGSGNGLWSDAANWDGGVVPEGANVLAVDFSHSNGIVTYNAAAGNTVLKNLNSATGLLLTGGSLTLGESAQDHSVLGGSAGLEITGGNLLLNGSLSADRYVQSGGLLGGSGNLAIGNSFSQTAGAINLGGQLRINQASGDLRFASLAASDVRLSALNGAIRQTGAIVASSLSTQSSNGTVLDNAGNQVGSFTANNSGGGGIVLNNTSAPGTLTLGTISSGAGNISIDNTGAISAGNIDSHGGNVALTSHSPVTLNGVVNGNDISITADTDVALADGARLNATRNVSLNAGRGISFDGAATVASGGNLAINAGDSVRFAGNASFTVPGPSSMSVLARTGSITGTSGVRINRQRSDVSLLAPGGTVSMPDAIFLPSTVPPVTVPPVIPPSVNTAINDALNIIKQGDRANATLVPTVTNTTETDKKKDDVKEVATADQSTGNKFNDGTKKIYCN